MFTKKNECSEPFAVGSGNKRMSEVSHFSDLPNDLMLSICQIMCEMLCTYDVVYLIVTVSLLAGNRTPPL